MSFDELRKVLHLARTQNLHQSAESLNLSVGALSKQLKKTEEKLQTQLFDRIGRHIVLNDQGRKFCLYAQQLVHEYEQMTSEFIGGKHQKVRIAGPSILLSTYAEKLSSALSYKQQSMSMQNLYEAQAIESVYSGHSDIALVTHEAKADWQQLSMSAIELGVIKYQVFASINHPLTSETLPLSMESLLRFPFACPERSPFCGVKRGVGSDNWHDHDYPRQTSFFSDDLQSQISIVQATQALSFLPDLVGEQANLVHLPIEELENLEQPIEQISLVYKPSMAAGWLNQYISRLTA